MGLDIITQRHCEVKEEIPQELLLKQILERNRGFAVFKMIVNSGKTQQEALETTFTFSSQRNDEVVNTELKVGDLINRTSHLDKLGEKCKNCVISQNNKFGCIGYISYPISYKCEQWLASISETSNKKGPPFSSMLDYIQESKIMGNRTKEMRDLNRTFLESPNPVEILIEKNFFKKKTIDTNKLLEVIFLEGLMQTTHINYLLMLFGGLISDPKKPDDRPSKFNDEVGQHIYLGLNLPKDHDKSMIEFYNYFNHLFLALMYDHDVFMH